MAKTITVYPIPTASTNPLDITFGSEAQIEFVITPEKLLNKDVTGIELTMVDYAGAHLHKGPINALVPWANMVTFIY